MTFTDNLYKHMKEKEMEEVKPNTVWCDIKIKPLEELKTLATYRDQDGLFIEEQWYMYEMDGLLPAHRTITVLREFDYFVWQDMNKDEWRIQASCVEQDLGDVAKPNYWVDEPNIPQAEPEPVVPEVNPFEGCATVFKKVKGSKLNNYPIEVGDLCLINGLGIPKIVQSISVDGKILVDGATTEFLAKDVYPLYKVNTVGCIVGDIVNTIKYGYVYLDSQEAVDEIANVAFNEHYRYTSPDDTYIPRETLKRFQGGEVTHNGRRLTDAEVQEALSRRFKPIVEEVDVNFELDVIAKHYGIKVKDVLPKEVKILKALEVVLDHPYCVQDKESALILGPSGSGKTQVAAEYAESKGLEYIIQGGSAQLTVDDLLGYNSITTGEYFPSLLRDAIENGKVFILDEIDGCSPNVLLSLNTFKRDVIQFPDKIVKVHPDFRFIATANTLSYSEDYNARSPLDRATLKRFSLIFYDLTKAEIALRYGFTDTKDLVDKLTTKKAYCTSEYILKYDCILEPIKDYDPRDIQRLVRNRKLEKEGVFNF